MKLVSFDDYRIGVMADRGVVGITSVLPRTPTHSNAFACCCSLSWVSTMEPGDLLFTGTPDGVGEIKPGDLVTMNISEVGEMSVPVEARKVG